jgi:ubiquinone/menaquinone biosynthesis C-methylase UbiE
MPKLNVTDAVESAYNIWSKTYEADENRTRDLAASALRNQSFDLQNLDALEIGCGTGLNTRFLAEHCRSVVALDFSAGMLEKARSNVTASNVKFVHQDVRLSWLVNTASVDLIVCTLVLEHIESLRHVFEEARRVLRANGEFLIYELHPFRQLQGARAQYKNVDSDEVTLISAFIHNVSDFVNVGIETGFQLIRLEEMCDEQDAAKNALPRILSLRLRARP